MRDFDLDCDDSHFSCASGVDFPSDDLVGVRRGSDDFNGPEIAGASREDYANSYVGPDVGGAVPGGPFYARGGDTTSRLSGASPVNSSIDGEGTSGDDGSETTDSLAQVTYAVPAVVVEPVVHENQYAPSTSPMPVSATGEHIGSSIAHRYIAEMQGAQINNVHSDLIHNSERESLAVRLYIAGNDVPVNRESLLTV
ncbi:hypothetical protein C8R43DRAFT_1132802 [Mycena crocata]|nr:hypothetical protein C8R43DRAFT_1132802 [Mycena crocata]